VTRTTIPVIEIYRGVGLHDQQDEARLALVRSDVDAAFALAGNVTGLVTLARDRSRAPEARLLAAALTLAEHELAVDERRVRPNVSREQLAAITAGLGTTRSPLFYDSIYSPLSLARQPGDSGLPVRRAQPLID